VPGVTIQFRNRGEVEVRAIAGIQSKVTRFVAVCTEDEWAIHGKAPNPAAHT